MAIQSAFQYAATHFCAQTNRCLFCRYFKAGGLPEQVVDLLSSNYKAMAQTANLLAEWLILAGQYYIVYVFLCPDPSNLRIVWSAYVE